MTLLTAIECLLPAMENACVRFALIGGLALNAHGYARQTSDIDFLVEIDDRSVLLDLLAVLGWGIDFESDNVLTAHASNGGKVRIDILWARRPVSRAMLGRSVELEVPTLSMKIPVVDATDLIGLKVQAYTNQPERKLTEQADILRLKEVCGESLDAQRLREYFELMEQAEDYRKLFGGAP